MNKFYRSLSPYLSMIVATILGWLVWQFSVSYSNEIEPLDAENGYYWISLLGSAFFAAILCPRFFWLAPIGLCIGQILYASTMYDPVGPIIMPAVISVPLFSVLPTCFGALIAFGFASIVTFATRKRINTPFQTSR